MNNGLLEGDGWGFKLGWVDLPYAGVRRVIKNCIAADNRAGGFTTNDKDRSAVTGMQMYNNLAYNNGWQDWYSHYVYGYLIEDAANSDATEELRRVYKNNIAYHNEMGAVNSYNLGAYTHDHNSWDSGVTVTDADFVNLDVSQLYAPRKADGSLPDITFGHLAPGSDLIDAGVDVGLPYSGSAPDIGPYETG